MLNSKYPMNPLDNAQLQRYAPSIFAQTPLTTLTDKYTFIPTIDAVEALRREGFYPVSASEQTTRIAEKRGYTRHVIRFRQHDQFNEVGEVKPEIVLLNSHDGSSSYQLSAGLFRLVCSNGLIVADSEIETIRCRHSGHQRTIDNVIEGTYSIINQMPETLENVKQMQAIDLTPNQQLALAKAALELKYDETNPSPIQPHQILNRRRYADDKPDLWTKFNVIQENLLRGGIRGRTKNNTRTTTREVKSINENVRLNKALWTLANEMKNLI